MDFSLARLFYPHNERHNMQDAVDERKNSDEQLESTGRTPQGILIERPLSTSPDTHPVNGNYSLPDEDDDEDDDDTEDDLILGDEDEFKGDEEEYEVEVDDDIDEDDLDDDDLVIDADEEDDSDDDL